MKNNSTLGKLLQNTRVKKGYSLEFVHSKLKIPIDALKALEEENFDFFPAKIYREGFLQAYAEFLELEKKDIEKLTQQIFKKNAISSKKKKISIEPDIIQKSMLASINPIYFKSAFFLFVIMSVLTIWLWRNSHYIQWKHDSSQKPDTSYQDYSFMSKLKIKFTDRTWIEIQADDKTVFEGFVPKGKVQSWQAHKNFKIKTFNPNSINLFLDNKIISLKIPKGKKISIPVTFSRSYYQ